MTNSSNIDMLKKQIEEEEKQFSDLWRSRMDLLSVCKAGKIPKPNGYNEDKCPICNSLLTKESAGRWETFPEDIFYFKCTKCSYEYCYSRLYASISPCFIATAAYGSELDPQLDILRAFRDQILIPNPLGNAFVEFYYIVSPPIADLIRPHEKIRAFVRTILKPIITYAQRKIR
jgi:hypothetical protein